MKRGKNMRIMNLGKQSLVIALLIFASVLFSSQISSAIQLDYTEGGHLDTDFVDAKFMAEWWYLNGKLELISPSDEIKTIGVFIVMAHQESPMLVVAEIHVSHMLTFCGLYPENGEPTIHYDNAFIPRNLLKDFVGIHKPYVKYRYPKGPKKTLKGNAQLGYYLNYTAYNIKMNLYFKPKVVKTIDEAAFPLNFTTYERAYGEIFGSVILNEELYKVIGFKSEGYMDHMIPFSTSEDTTWPMEMNGWNWFEVTTKDYQAIFYGIRGLEDGFDTYSYKHLTLLSRDNGIVLDEYEGNEIIIDETDWVNDTAGFLSIPIERPTKVILEIIDDDTKIKVNAGLVNRFDPDNLDNSPTSFVDFMGYEPGNAEITFDGETQTGSSFFEYLVSDFGAYITLP